MWTTAWTIQAASDAPISWTTVSPDAPPPRKVLAQGEGDADGWVEMGPGHPAHGEDDRHTIYPGATTAAARPTEPGMAVPIVGPPAATSTRKKVPSSPANNRRHSGDGSLKSWIIRPRRYSAVENGNWTSPESGRLFMPMGSGCDSEGWLINHPPAERHQWVSTRRATR